MLSYAQLPIVKCTSSMHFPHIITMYETGRRANLTDKCVDNQDNFHGADLQGDL